MGRRKTFADYEVDDEATRGRNTAKWGMNKAKEILNYGGAKGKEILLNYEAAKGKVNNNYEAAKGKEILFNHEAAEGKEILNFEADDENFEADLFEAAKVTGKEILNFEADDVNFEADLDELGLFWTSARAMRDKPYQCPVCLRFFVDEEGFERHQVCHLHGAERKEPQFCRKCHIYLKAKGLHYCTT